MSATAADSTSSEPVEQQKQTALQHLSDPNLQQSTPNEPASVPDDVASAEVSISNEPINQQQQTVIEDAKSVHDEQNDVAPATDSAANEPIKEQQQRVIEDAKATHNEPVKSDDVALAAVSTSKEVPEQQQEKESVIEDPKKEESDHYKPEFVKPNDVATGVAEGSGNFTMRELLGDLKKENEQTDSPFSREATQQQIDENNAAMDLINSVTGADEEGRSRQKILTFAARRYASAIEKNPDDYDALYNWALVLQESADNVGPDSGSSAKDALLEEACKKYEETTRLCPTLHDAYYNRAIAISDRAKMRGRTKEAEELWKQATYNYEKAVQLNWNTPQALNNWGLALQELSAIVPAREKQTIVKTAINKFRGAIALQFDFHRAIYNLGTVLYGLAEDISRMGGSSSVKDVSPDELYSLSAIYIAAAHALKPSYSVYTSALKLVRSMLPLPYLKVGYLTAPPLDNPVAPHSDWKRTQFVLDNEGLQQIHRIEQSPMSPSLSGRSGDTLRPAIKVDVADIVSVYACGDLTLPPGAALCIDTVHGPVYLIADSWESLDGWLDAIRLVYTIFARGKSEVLAGIVTG